MDILFHNNRLLVPIETKLFKGWGLASEHKLIQGTPKFTWKGARIPFTLWSQVVAFLRWTQVKYKQEAHVTFFYDTTHDTWAAWPFPQEPNGMTVKLLPNHPMYELDRQQFKNGWIQAGSVHHHCTSKAFQSGTDKADESEKDGVHITLGEMDKAVLDAHVRQVFDGVMGETELLDWIEEPEYLRGTPEYLRDQFADFACRAVMDPQFPEEWKHRIIERTFNPSFPLGSCHSASLTPQTLLTKAEPNQTSPHQKRGRRRTEAGTKTKWSSEASDRLMSAITGLTLTAKEAYDLLTKYDFTNAAEDLILRRELVTTINKTGIPLLYAESLLEQVLGIDADGVAG